MTDPKTKKKLDFTFGNRNALILATGLGLIGSGFFFPIAPIVMGYMDKNKEWSSSPNSLKWKVWSAFGVLLVLPLLGMTGFMIPGKDPVQVATEEVVESVQEVVEPEPVTPEKPVEPEISMVNGRVDKSKLSDDQLKLYKISYNLGAKHEAEDPNMSAIRGNPGFGPVTDEEITFFVEANSMSQLRELAREEGKFDWRLKYEAPHRIAKIKEYQAKGLTVSAKSNYETFKGIFPDHPAVAQLKPLYESAVADVKATKANQESDASVIRRSKIEALGTDAYDYDRQAQQSRIAARARKKMKNGQPLTMEEKSALSNGY